jgi:hypothetical protein
VATEILHQDDDELRAKIGRIVDEGAGRLHDEIDRALAVASADLGVIVEAIAGAGLRAYEKIGNLGISQHTKRRRANRHMAIKS